MEVRWGLELDRNGCQKWMWGWPEGSRLDGPGVGQTKVGVRLEIEADGSGNRS